MKDVLAFLPSYKRQLQAYKISVIRINAQAKGYVKDITIPIFEVSGFGDTYVKLSGHLKGLPDAKNAYYDVNINQFTSTKKDILSLAPPNSLPNTFNLPDRFALNGFFKGGMKAFATRLALKTNKGNITVDGSMKPGNAYAIKANLQNVDAGYLSKQPQNVGIITANISAIGSGFDIKKANEKYNVDVVSAQVKGYTYTDVKLDGTINNGVTHTTASVHDPNISLNLDATADLHTLPYAPVKLDLQLDTLNAKALNLMTDTLSVSGHVLADFSSTNPDNLIGTLNVDSLHLTQGSRTYYADSISMVASGDSTNKSIVIAADAINASLIGQYKLTDIAHSLQQTINQY